MEDIELIINITKHEWEYLNKLVENGDQLGHYERLLVNGTPLPKGHGRLIDISKIEEDRTDDDNPIIYLTIDGHYTEAVSLDYLNDLSTIVEADKEVE